MFVFSLVVGLLGLPSTGSGQALQQAQSPDNYRDLAYQN